MDRNWNDIKSTVRDLDEWIRAREGWGSKHEHHQLVQAQDNWEHTYRNYARQLGYKSQSEIQEEEAQKWYFRQMDHYTRNFTEKDFEYLIRLDATYNRPNLYSSAIRSDISYKWRNDPECNFEY